jgi:hypothetical protein
MAELLPVDQRQALIEDVLTRFRSPRLLLTLRALVQGFLKCIACSYVVRHTLLYPSFAGLG